jgi:hypothetical protein
VSEFVEECRREWKRLRVPGAIADEMAGDLTADLEEAEADGASVEEVLGSGASDPRAFAAAWAKERGIVRPRWSARLPKPRLLVGILIAFALFVLLAVVGAGLALLASSGDSSPVRGIATQVQPTVVPGRIYGTYMGSGAKASPSNMTLIAGRRNVLDRLPTSISISFGNTGSAKIDRLTVFVTIDHRPGYVHIFHGVAPGSKRSLRVALPKNLPRNFVIVAQTLPVAGEFNTSNNRMAWRVAIRQ